MDLVVLNFPQDATVHSLNEYMTIDIDDAIIIVDAFTFQKHKYIVIKNVEESINLKLPYQPILLVQNQKHDTIMITKWDSTIITDIQLSDYITEHKLILLMKEMMFQSQIIVPIHKMKEIVTSYLKRQMINQLNTNQVIQLLELAYQYSGLLLYPQQTNDTPGREYVPELYVIFDDHKLHEYISTLPHQDEYLDYGNMISIRFPCLMFELPTYVLKTLHGCLTKISQCFRAIFPNIWPQSMLNLMTRIIIYPNTDETIIAMVTFSYYTGYHNHPNTSSILDSFNQLNNDGHWNVSLEKPTNEVIVPFPTIHGVSPNFHVDEPSMSVKVAWYNSSLDFGEQKPLPTFKKHCIPGDQETGYGYIPRTTQFDPHQYHYILRRIMRVLLDTPFTPYLPIDRFNIDDLMVYANPIMVMIADSTHTYWNEYRTIEKKQRPVIVENGFLHCHLFPMY